MSSDAGLFLVSAPSGAGKTSLVRKLTADDPNLTVSVSWTTRPRRPRERNGEDYHFVADADFRQAIQAGQFLEYAQVFDYYYGTTREQVTRQLANGIDVLLEIDWQGAQQVRTALTNTTSIFILPPSRAELEKRLRGRRTDSDGVIARRLQDAQAEMSHWHEFGYIVVNDNFAHAVDQLRRVIDGTGEGLRADRPGLEALIRDLLG